MSMTIKGISDATQALLKSMTTPKFVDVFPAPESKDTKFTGYPSVVHFYENTENGYATVTQNRRVIKHNIYVYMVGVGDNEIEKWQNGIEMVDKIIQEFDESIDLGGACDIMRPAPGEMSKASLGGGEGLIAEIILYCEADVTFRNA